ADFPGRDTVCNASCVKLQLLAVELLELMNSNGRIFSVAASQKKSEFLVHVHHSRVWCGGLRLNRRVQAVSLTCPSLLSNLENPLIGESGLRLDLGINRLLSR